MLSFYSMFSFTRTTLPYRIYISPLLSSLPYLRVCIPDYPSDRDGDFPTELGMGMGPIGNTGTAMESMGAVAGKLTVILINYLFFHLFTH